MTDKTKDERRRQERFNPDDVDDETIWEGYAYPPIVHNHVYLYLMKKAAEEPDHYKVLAFYEKDVPALVIARRENKKLIDWTAKALPDLSEDLARQFVAITISGYGFNIEDTMFYTKIKSIRPPILVK